ncbi:MAG: MerR family transcriptional regulator [Clostridia bacterium]|nr:MerR family transcriptional regulator [Clostridia bacterium]
MKINEVEELLNTPRANIRYYEKEGLINISRKENGYGSCLKYEKNSNVLWMIHCYFCFGEKNNPRIGEKRGLVNSLNCHI